MIQLALEAYDSINEGIDLLEKEMNYNPIMLLGIRMYPERITGFLTTAFMFTVTTAYTNFSK